ncbi:MAG: sugar phosphorylase [Victivallaceae bacterium]|nr:sugar phosphorylase [Victivallaceae bacterium]
MKIAEILAELYGAETAAEYGGKLREKLTAFKRKHPPPPGFELDEKAALLITYGDMAGRTPTANPLRTLHEFLLEYAGNMISAVHILPFFPYSSDAGFAVTDYRQVDPRLGSWRDIETFGRDFSLAFDAVFNHASVKGKWFQGFLSGKPPYRNWFIEPETNFDSSRVFRPRALPLFHDYADLNGELRRVWTTFSADQADLNFHSPDLLLELIDLLLLYLARGARLIRLDAIAFCWKESGTSCLHLPQAHLIVKLFRQIADEVSPGTLILTETNVPHRENIAYFGDGDEAHLVYQFPLPPLTAQAILRGDATALTAWATGLEEPPPGCTFLNFLASHDGIGVRPLTGLTPGGELSFLAEDTRRKGGKVSYKNNPDGSRSPYELNINYYNLLREPGEELELSVRKFILSQAIMLTMPGIPGIYFHSLFGSENWTEGLPENSENRAVNREKIPADMLRSELQVQNSRRQLIYRQYRDLLTVRKRHPGFHPKSGFRILNLKPEVFAILRGTKVDDMVLALFNVNSNPVRLTVDDPTLPARLYSLRNGELTASDNLYLNPFEFKWLSATHSNNFVYYKKITSYTLYG